MKNILVKIANNMYTILFIYVVSIILSSLLFSFIESRSIVDGIWWSCISALTIWYGDIAPITYEWKILGIFFWHFWIFFIVPMIVVNIMTKVIEDQNEFTEEEQKLILNKLDLIINNIIWKK